MSFNQSLKLPQPIMLTLWKRFVALFLFFLEPLANERPDALKEKLMSMGFPEDLAIRACRKYPNAEDEIQRIEWILSGMELQLIKAHDLDPPAEKPQKKQIKKRILQKIPRELQMLFASLALSNQRAISTEDLTKSFGWSESAVRQQHDVHELNRVCCEHLASLMLSIL